MGKWIRTGALVILCLAVAGSLGWTAWNVNNDSGRWIGPAASAVVPGLAQNLEPVVREEVRAWLEERFENRIHESVNAQVKSELESFAESMREDLSGRIDTLTEGASEYLTESVPSPEVLDALIMEIIAQGLSERITDMTVTTEDIWQLLLLAAKNQQATAPTATTAAAPSGTPGSTATSKPSSTATLKPTAKKNN